MPFAQNWVESEPDGTLVTVSQLDNWIRNTKIAIRERLEDTLFVPGSFASAPVLQGGIVGGVVSPLASATYLNWAPGASIKVIIPGFVGHMNIAAIDEPVAGYARLILGSNGTAQYAWPMIPSAVAADFPAGGSTTFQGLIAVDSTNNRLVVFSGNQRYYINFGGTF